MGDSELRFPGSYTIGTISVRPKNAIRPEGNPWDERSGWRYLAPARGIVRVPEGHGARIETDIRGYSTWRMTPLGLVPTIGNDILEALTAIEPTVVEQLDLSGLEQLSLIGLHNALIPDAEIAVVCRFPELRSLNLAGRELPTDGFARLSASLPHLTNLSTRWAPGLENVRSLRTLSVFGNNFHDTDVARISQLPDLVSLWLNGKNLTGACLSHLTALTNLEELRLVGVPVHDADLQALPLLRNLKSIDIEGGQLTDSAILPLSQLTQLEHLHIGEAGFSEDGFRTLWNYLPHLAELILVSSAISDNGLSGCHHLANLQRLNLNSTGLTDAGLRQLGGLPRLHELYINQTRIRGKEGSLWSGLSGLRTLDLSGTLISDSTLREVGANLADLETLYLNGASVSDEGLSFLVGLKRLKHLHLHSVSLSGTALESISQIGSLEDLVFDGTGVRGDDLAPLAALTGLKDLMIEGLTGADKALKVLSRLKNLQWLRLMGCDLTDVGMAAVAQFEQLEGLSLLNNRVTDSGLAYLKDSLPRLRSLDLTGNPVSVPALNDLYLARPETEIYAV